MSEPRKGMTVNATISRVQLVFLLAWTVLGTGLITIPYIMANFTSRDGWIVILMFLGSASLVAGVVWAFNRMFPQDSLYSVFDKVFGRRIGPVIALWGTLWALIFLAMVLREFNLFVEVTVLPRTALYVINGVMTFAFAYAVSQGIEVVGRLAELFSVIVIVIFLILMALPLRVADIHLLQPVLAYGWRPVLRAAVIPDISFALELMVAIQFLPMVKERTKLPLDILISGAIIVFLLLVGYISGVSVLGSASTYLTYPGVEVVRSIRYGQLIERLDTLLVMIILLTMFLKFSVLHYVFCDLLRYSFQLSSIRSVSLPAAALAWASSLLLWKNSSALQNFMLYGTPIWFMSVLLGVPVTAMAVWTVKRQSASRS